MNEVRLMVASRRRFAAARPGARAALALLACSLGFAAAGCRFDTKVNKAHGCKDCPPDMCYLGYCLVDRTPSVDAGSSGTGGTGSDARVGTGSAGTSGAQANAGQPALDSGMKPDAGNKPDGGKPDSGHMLPTGPCQAGRVCWLGKDTERGIGACRDGQEQCQGMSVVACGGEVLPLDESCNAIDDDCDGKVDEEVTLGSCNGTGQGACTTGQLRCQDGVESCGAGEPKEEICNGLDDDCDGTVDDGISTNCYPDGTAGCTKKEDGSYDCVGACTAGKQTCENGKLSECKAVVTPVTEKCGGDQAIDEDCDGRVDNGCPCTGTQTQGCYSGPFLSWLFGTCRIGTQRCQSGTFGPCEGQVVPVAESCANPNADNDCNNVVDDIGRVGQACTVTSSQGVCRSGVVNCRNNQLACVTPGAQAETRCDGLDEDCDGRVNETFALATDEANCGACGRTCAGGQLCCGGMCRTIATDPGACGACGTVCGEGMACCNGGCVATGTNAHCTGADGCGACAGGADICCDKACVAPSTHDHCTGANGCGACAGGGDICCGKACVAPQTHDHCTGANGCGTCAGAGEICCSSACVAPQTHDHCTGANGCGTCAGGGEICCSSACVAPQTNTHCTGGNGCGACTSASEICCSSACVAPQTNTHCTGNGCGACGSPTDICCESQCAAPQTSMHCTGGNGCGACSNAGDTCCAGICANLAGDPTHCGGCDSATHTCAESCPMCVSGVCQVDSQTACTLPP